MFKVWVDINTGEWGFVTDLRVIDVQWWDEFQKLFENADTTERIRISKAFGKQLK